MSGQTLFDAEEKVIESAEEILINDNYKENPLLSPFSSLLKNYKKLYKQTLRLIKLNDMQQQQLNAAIKDVEEAKEIAEAANKSKSDFLANMSHEIRTPMNAVIGMSTLALKIDSPPRVRSYLNTIKTSAHSLLRLINDILDFSKIEAGKMDMEITNFNLLEVIESLSDMFGSKVVEKGLEMILSINKDVPLNLVGDPFRLAQVLINLVSNAVKFTEEGEIVINVSCIEKSNNKVILKFSIKDTGIGINPSQCDKLFKAFTQADSSITRKYGGTGLGLVISKCLVEMMGGNLLVESRGKIGQGSTFYFTAEFGFDEQKAKDITAHNFNSAKILVVDDNKTIRDSLEQYLKSFCPTVMTVSSSDSAIEELKLSPYNIVILDSMMWGMDEIRTVKKIKNDFNIPIIMMIEYGKDMIWEQAKEVGADDFVVKPVKQSLLFDSIAKVFIPDKDINYREQLISKEDDYLKSLGGYRILLVEDNPINQQLAKELLEGVGISVDIACNGKEGVETVCNYLYDAVLMDVQMPEMDGLEATKTIRRIENSEEADKTHIPIIAMTAHATKEDHQKCINSGMDDYLVKPIDPEQLYLTLKKWLPEKEGRTFTPVKKQTNIDSDIPDSVPGILIMEGIKRTGGNQKLYLNILFEFAENYFDFIKKVKKAIEENKFEIAMNTLHTLKGVAGNISAKELYNIVKHIEEELKLHKCISKANIENAEKEMKLICDSIINLKNKFNQNKKDLENSKNKILVKT
ncbi:MAG: response regulator, partial [Desulfobacterales bacterium]|nr:response regulator [Desulfobacterales bacterium]